MLSMSQIGNMTEIPNLVAKLVETDISDKSMGLIPKQNNTCRCSRVNYVVQCITLYTKGSKQLMLR